MSNLQRTRLKVTGLTKSFYDVRAIDSVDFEFVGGEIHGLLGENGAGKSTLCSVLAGLYRPDSGRITIDDEPVVLRSPQDASQRGIGMVYQHFRLVDSFTVAENIALGMGRTLGMSRTLGKGGLRTVETRVAELSEEYQLHVDPTATVWQLSVGEQQRVEILKQLFRGARILILDEPTAVLAPQEAEQLFDAVDHMVASGHAVVLVSHKMNEILNHTDRVTVLRAGLNAGTAETADTTPAELGRMMFGNEIEPSANLGGRSKPSRGGVSEEPTAEAAVLSVENLKVRGDRGQLAVDGVSLELQRGQIVGVAGVAGNGQRELQEAIAGLRSIESGSLTIAGTDCTTLGPNSRYELGLAYVPEDRLGTGLAPGLTLEHNMVLRSYRRAPHSRAGILSPSNIARTAADLVEQFDVRGARRGMRVSLMSGGNLQKAILARELTEEHDVLLAAAPTRGLDIAAANSVRRHILSERDEGRGVLVFSEDLAEVIELSDVVLVVFKGRIVGAFDADELDLDRIGLLMTGAVGAPGATEAAA